MPAKVIEIAAGYPHGSRQDWEDGCDCFDCKDEMRSWISRSSAPRNPSWTLSYMIDFRTAGAQLAVPVRALAHHCHVCERTTRSHIAALIRVGLLSKGPTVETALGRAQSYLFHPTRLAPRPDFIEHFREPRRPIRHRHYWE